MIYFIGNKQYNWVKIGTTNNIRTRLHSMNTYCPFELTVFAVYSGIHSNERYLHKLFNDDRIKGEWYNLSSSVQDYIDSHPSLDTNSYEGGFKLTNVEYVMSLYNSGTSQANIASTMDRSLHWVNKIINKNR